MKHVPWRARWAPQYDHLNPLIPGIGVYDGLESLDDEIAQTA